MVDLFNQNDNFNLVIAPEATRAKDGEARKPFALVFGILQKQPTYRSS
jgi:1-acyl-sn-glycerol-3-phosphate acyltransferase